MKIIDYAKIEENLKIIKKTNDICLVIKNDAYGFGMDRIINIAEKCEVDMYAVNNIKEAFHARSYTNRDILIMGRDDVINQKLPKGFFPNASTSRDVANYNSLGQEFALEIDAGMNRFGFKNLESINFNNPLLKIVYVHFHIDRKENYDWIKYLKQLSHKYKKRICFGGSLIYGKTNECLRIGRVAYQDSISFYGKIIQIKSIKKGEAVGYDEKYIAKDDELLAILNVGYYDGLNPDYDGYVFFNNKYFKVVGRVCMNHTFVVIDESVSIGNYLEFVGDNIRMKDFLVANKMTEYQCFLSLK